VFGFLWWPSLYVDQTGNCPWKGGNGESELAWTEVHSEAARAKFREVANQPQNQVLVLGVNNAMFLLLRAVAHMGLEELDSNDKKVEALRRHLEAVKREALRHVTDPVSW
jgi:hypothetical protein